MISTLFIYLEYQFLHIALLTIFQMLSVLSYPVIQIGNLKGNSVNSKHSPVFTGVGVIAYVKKVVLRLFWPWRKLHVIWSIASSDDAQVTKVALWVL